MRTLTADRISDEPYRQGESPRVDPRTGELIWVDIVEGRFHRGRLEQGLLTTVRSYDLGRPVGVAAPVAGTRTGWVLAAGDGFRHLAEDGTITTLVSGLTSGTDQLNDGIVHPDGSFWAGSQAIPREPRAALFRLGDDATATQVLDGLTVANGIDFTPDGNTMYFVDTLPHRRLEAFDVSGGRPRNRRTITEITDGNPDGLTLDDEGCIWVAVWDASEVRRFTPTGRLDTVVRLPVPRPTAVCLHDTTLIITTASIGLDSPPNGSGHLYAADTGTTGQPTRPWTGLGDSAGPAADRGHGGDVGVGDDQAVELDDRGVHVQRNEE